MSVEKILLEFAQVICCTKPCRAENLKFQCFMKRKETKKLIIETVEKLKNLTEEPANV